MKVENPKLKALNPKHQANVNRFLTWDAKYATIVNETDDCGGPKQEHAYNKASEYFHTLPKREQAKIGKVLCIAGY